MIRVKANFDPESLWHPTEIRQVSALFPLRGSEDAFLLTFPLRETQSGVVYYAAAQGVRMEEGEILIDIRSCAIHKKPQEFLWLAANPAEFGTAVLFLRKGLNHNRLGFPYVRGTRGDVVLPNGEFTTYFLHSGAIY
jgi:hypothetical protein